MMNSNALGKTRTQVVKKLVFLFVFALVALAYVATPLAAFAACPGGDGKGVAANNDKGKNPNNDKGKNPNNDKGNNPNNDKGNNPNNDKGNNKGNPIGASTKISGTDLKLIINGLEIDTLQFTDSTGNTVDFSALQIGSQFEIIASDTTNNTTQNISAKLLNKTLALVTLPSNIQQQIFFDNIKSPCQSSKAFPISFGGSTIQAQCLDNQSASVKIPGSSIPVTMIFPPFPKN